MTDLARAASGVLATASALGHGCALVGGFAVSVRTAPRFTRDVDFAVAVSSDAEAEAMVRSLLAEGHELVAVVEQEARARLATARLLCNTGDLVDLLFASSGIEAETVAAADVMEVVPGFALPVASVGHLIAMKLLSQSDQRLVDRSDLQALLTLASPDDLAAAACAVTLIEERGFARGRDLTGDLRAATL